MFLKHLFEKYQILLILATLVVLILVAFEPVRHNKFVNYDDDKYITENPHIQSGITVQSIVWAFTTGYFSYWHPLTWLSHMLDIELFGLNPLGHHLHNLILHIAVTVLLFLVLRNMTGALWRSVFVAMVFGIHPLRVESVAWAAERKDLLCGLFWMLTMAAYLGYARHGGTGRYLLVVLCFLLGLMAKPMIVTLPLILLVLDVWPLGRVQKSTARNRTKGSACKTTGTDYRPISIFHLVMEKIPLLVMTLASCIVTYLVQQKGHVMSSFDALPFVSRFLNALVSYTGYLSKTFWPGEMAVLYPLPITGHPLWKPIISFVLLVLLSGRAVYNVKKQSYLLAGWLWYLVTLIPVIGLIQVGSQAMADRYTYLPSIGIYVIISWAAAELSAEWPYRKIILATLSGISAIAMVAGTRHQVAYWKDSLALNEHAAAVTRDNFVIYNNLGVIFKEQGRLDEAGKQFAKILQLYPNHWDANNNMACVLILNKQYDQALGYLLRAQKSKPDDASIYYNLGMVFEAQGKLDDAIHSYEQAARLNPYGPQFFFKVGTLKAQQGFPSQAEEYFRKSIQLSPNSTKAYQSLGLALQEQGRLREAIVQYRIALQKNANDYETWYHLGNCLLLQGKLQEAVNSYHRVLTLKPDYIPVLNNLAWLLATTWNDSVRNPSEAVRLARKVCESSSFKNPNYLDTLAAAYAGTGQFDKAVETAQNAITLAQTANQADLVNDLSKKLQLYKSGQAYHEPSPEKQEPDKPETTPKP